MLGSDCSGDISPRTDRITAPALSDMDLPSNESLWQPQDVAVIGHGSLPNGREQFVDEAHIVRIERALFSQMGEQCLLESLLLGAAFIAKHYRKLGLRGALAEFGGGVFADAPGYAGGGAI
jgi:heme oxygenase